MNATILVVEDNPTTRRLVRAVLEAEGLRVLEAPDGATARQIMATGQPDLVLQDLVLPDVDGWELVTELRALPGASEVPFLAFSSFLSPQVEGARAASAGFDDVVVKPVDPARLAQMVLAHLPTPVSSAVPLRRPKRLLVVDDDPIQLKLLKHHLGALGYEVSTHLDGADAYEAAATERPDAIVSDVLMPRLDGFGLCRRVRQDPGLASTPVILVSVHYVEGPDQKLAREVGANALVLRELGYAEIVSAVRRALDGSLPTPTAQPGAVVEEHLHRVVRQLERQVATSAGLAQRCSLQATQLLVLSEISDALMRHVDLDTALRDVLSACLDASGISLGALYLVGDDGELAVHAHAGFSPAQVEWLPSFFGHLELLTVVSSSGAALEVPSTQVGREVMAHLRTRGEMTSASVHALVHRGQPLGALVLASRHRDLRAADLLAFARTVSNQIAQAVSLARAFQQKDASERRAREQATVLRSVLDSMAEGVTVVDAQGRRVLWNAAAQQLVGLLREGRPLLSGDGETPLPDADNPISRALRGDLVDTAEICVRGEDKTVCYEVTARPMRSGAAITGGVVVYRDISPERAATEALHRARSDFRRFIEVAPEGVAVRDGTRLLYTNPAFARSLGYETATELIGSDIASVIHPDDVGLAAGAVLPAGDGDAPLHVRARRRDGSYVTLELSRPQPVEFEGRPALLALARDVTERSRLQAQLLVSDRMASAGLLAAGVAHEINNPLAVVIGNLDLAALAVAELAETLGGQADLSELDAELHDASEAAGRVRQIVRDLKIFSRSEDERRGPVDVRRSLESTLRMAWNEVRHRARLVKDYGPVPFVEANESRLGQVFLNLVVNAAQAIPEGHADDNEIRVVTRTDAQGRAVVEVRDSGSGMGPETLRQLFTPFFTTKPVGVGTGLGLSICHRLVTGLGGEIAVESALGVGTTFFVTLPPAKAAAPVAATLAAAAPVPKRAGRILVIDDEEIVGRVVGRTLASQHEVVTESSAVHALERLASGETFDVILCDLMMPVMTGMEFFAELSRRDPLHAERVVFVTGGAFTPAAREFLERVKNERVEKPFDVKKLSALVAERIR